MTVKALKKKNNMARTTGKSGFKMRSGNGPLKFKTMGSSPVKQNIFSQKIKPGILRYIMYLLMT